MVLTTPQCTQGRLEPRVKPSELNVSNIYFNLVGITAHTISNPFPRFIIHSAIHKTVDSWASM